jgi:hypothetical protein
VVAGVGRRAAAYRVLYVVVLRTPSGAAWATPQPRVIHQIGPSVSTPAPAGGFLPPMPIVKVRP